jgi:hypothetical protein
MQVQYIPPDIINNIIQYTDDETTFNFVELLTTIYDEYGMNILRAGLLEKYKDIRYLPKKLYKKFPDITHELISRFFKKTYKHISDPVAIMKLNPNIKWGKLEFKNIDIDYYLQHQAYLDTFNKNSWINTEFTFADFTNYNKRINFSLLAMIENNKNIELAAVPENLREHFLTNINCTLPDIKRIMTITLDNVKFFDNNTNLTLNDLIIYPNTNYHHVAKNPNITINDINSHPELPWIYSELLHNINIDMDDIATNPNLLNAIDFNFENLAANPNITSKVFAKYPQMLKYIYSNVNFTLEELNAYGQEVNDSMLMHKPDLTIDQIVNATFPINYPITARNHYVHPTSWRYVKDFAKLPVTINNKKIEVSKDFIYGLVIAAHIVKYPVNVDYFGFKFDKNSVEVLINFPGFKRYSIKLPDDRIYHFDSLDFLVGLKTLYNKTNNVIPKLSLRDKTEDKYLTVI